LSDLIKIHKLNEVHYQIECDEQIAYELYSYFEMFVPGYTHSPKYKLKCWSGKISFFHITYRTLPIGLFSFFQDFCKENNYTYEFQFKKEELSISDEELEIFYKDIFKDSKFYPRDYQKDLIKLGLNNKRGLLISSTSSGKSLTLYCLIRWILREKKKVVLVVPSIMLVNQMYGDFADYGWTDIDKYVSKLYGGETPDYKKPVLISTFQSLKMKSDSLFEKYGAILVDEVQFQKTDSLQRISRKCINADYRLGLTGTLDKSEKCDLFNIFGYLGTILKTITTQELTEKGWLTKAYIRNLIVNYSPKFIKENKNLEYEDEKKLIYSNPDRNKVLNFIYKTIPDGQNSLILLNEIEHLKSVKTYIEQSLDKKFKLIVIHGQVKPEKREELKIFMESNTNVILLASFGTLSTGINIKSIGNIILFSSSRSEIRVLQSIGRGLRLLQGKTRIVIWDIIDSLRYKTIHGNTVENNLYKHWAGSDGYFGVKKGRLSYYKEQKFEYKILEKDLDTL
jgi:Kyanoviridae DNA helicase